MKKLSIEEKAKAYDRVVKEVKDFFEGRQKMYSDVTQTLEHLFPELAESEDERMIKFIKNQLFNIKKTITDNYKLDTELTKAIDWLEKQGEKPQRIVSAEAKEAMYDKPAPVRTGPIGFDGEPMESKPCEQKPDEWEPQTGDTFRKKNTTSPTYHLCNKREDGITFGFVENREVGISGGEITIFALKNDYELVERPKLIEDVVKEELNRALQTKGEQKPKFRIGDTIKKKSTGDIVTICEIDLKNREYRLSNTGFIPFKCEYLWELVEQKPAEWSDADESNFSELCSFIVESYRPEDACSLVTWLRELRDRYTWKPDKLQLECLSDAIISYNRKGYPASVLKELLDQLKKLKG